MRKTNLETAKEILEVLKQEQNPALNTDRRIRAKRLRVAFTVQVSHQGSPIQGWAEAQNISFSGMLLATNFPVLVNDDYTLEFTLPNHEIPIRVSARVVRVIDGKAAEDPTAVAMAFISVDSHVSKMISGFVLEHIATY